MSHGKVLLLNASWEPLRTISIRRAVVMILQDVAEIVERGEGEMRSPSISVPIPEVVRLVRWVKVPYRARIPLNGRNVLERDRYACAYCGKHASTIDHVVPRSRGGRHRWENVVAACPKCNHRKGDQLLSELGWELRHQPYVPRGDVWLVFGQKPRESWEPYLAVA
jgi:5-methylcytosine-specific restriction endonuclease McrA